MKPIKLTDAQMDAALGLIPVGRVNVCEDCKRECADGELSTMGLCPQCKPGGKPELTHVEKTLLGALK